MQETGAIELLRQYAREGSEEAFETLMAGHVDLVYSVALRKTGNPHAAEEITQAVFIILAQKADKLRRGTILPGWLYQTARLTAANYLRTEIRRSRREQEACVQSFDNETGPEAWSQLAPLLEDAMGRLGGRDRDAIVLRFMQRKNFQEIGAAFGASENAAKKRVGRALEKLRKILAKRGVVSTAVGIAGAMAAHSVQAAPAGLAKTISVVTLAKGAAAGASTLTLVKGALKLMAWTHAKTAVVVGVGVLLAAGATTVTVREIQEHLRYNWQVRTDDTSVLAKAPPMVEILPTKFQDPPSSSQGIETGVKNMKRLAFRATMSEMICSAYDFPGATRMFHPKLPQERYDFIVSLPKGCSEALAQEIKRKFGIVARREMRETNVFLLVVKNANAQGLKVSTNTYGNMSSSDSDNFDKWRLDGQPVSALARICEDKLEVPVVDRTDLTNKFDIDLQWRWEDGVSEADAFKQALLDQLGLELVPSHEPIEMLVVEKAK
jgi:uncharacterized protein (TIGR03435 family)